MCNSKTGATCKCPTLKICRKINLLPTLREIWQIGAAKSYSFCLCKILKEDNSLLFHCRDSQAVRQAAATR